MKFYLHKNTGYYDAYFGNVGTPFQVTYGRYLRAKSRGYVATKAPDNHSIAQVHVKAQIEAGSHPTSFRVNEIKESYRKKEIEELNHLKEKYEIHTHR